MDQMLTRLRREAQEIFEAGLAAVVPAGAVDRFCRLEGSTLVVDQHPYELDSYERILVIGAGKGGASMALAIETLLGERITDGLVVVKYGHLERLEKIRLLEASHPVPDENGFRAAQALYQLAGSADERTLVICLISGGGSALIPLPVDGVSLADKQETTRVLLACGADIHEINTIRKHLSVIKGGGLARAVFPGTLVTLILSDVIGDDLDSIASGPCVPDPKTFGDCLAILTKYGISERVPPNVVRHIRAGIEGVVPETPKEGDPAFSRTANVIIGGNYEALEAARRKAAELGYHALLLSSMIEGDTRDVAANHAAMAREIVRHGQPVPTPACLLSGGETTVNLRGSGTGGRCQEFALAAALKLDGLKNCVVLCAGTDGTDGPTDAAGAFCDGDTVQRSKQLALDPLQYLDDNDSYHFFERLGDLYKTGPTNTNVMDLRLVLVG